MATLILLGALLCGMAVVERGWTLVAGWLGLDFLIVGVAQLAGAHGVFGKRADGTLAWWSWALFLPLHIYSLAVLKISNGIGREPRICCVDHGLFVGSRPGGKDRHAEFANVVDLTAEFQEPKAFREMPGYFCFPILDACAPSIESLERAVMRSAPVGATFVHCAQGHGRTGLFAACWLISKRRAKTGEEALRMLMTARPGIRLNEVQRRCLAEFEKRISERAGSEDVARGNKP